MIAKAGLTMAVALGLASGVMPATDAMAQENRVVAAVENEPSSTATAPKSDLDQSAVTEVVDQTPRPILTSTRGVVLPKILGSYR